MWRKILNDTDIQIFMNKINFFHDACVKGIHYISGAYVKENLSMFPINTQRTLEVEIHRQCSDDSVIFMRFNGLKYMRLYPIDENYTCEISNASLFLKNDLIYWCDGFVSSEIGLDEFTGTIICASKLQWRSESIKQSD